MAEVEHVERKVVHFGEQVQRRKESSALYSTTCIAYKLSVMCRGGGRRCEVM